MSRIQIASCLALLVGSTACSTLNYPTESSESKAAANHSEQAPSAPILLGLGFGVPEDDLTATLEEPALDWSELTRQARANRQRGRYEVAREKLEQAATQLSARPGSNAQRRAVFGMRARLAIDFIALKQDENADLLADQLFEEVEQEPELGGPAVAELAYLMATRRGAAAKETGLPVSQLPLLRIALLASEPASASIARLSLAYEVSDVATREGDHDLARRAIDRAVLDAQVVAPSDQDQLASLKIFKARIALAQGDLVTAEASATSANRIFDEMGAPSANRAVAEATLARVLAEKGDIERARVIGVGAAARLEGDPPITGHPARIVLAELGRLERAAGDSAAARVQFEAALDLPGIDFSVDRELVSKLTMELAALETTSAQTPIELDVETETETEVEMEMEMDENSDLSP